jgi:hypothetical protein
MAVPVRLCLLFTEAFFDLREEGAWEAAEEEDAFFFKDFLFGEGGTKAADEGSAEEIERERERQRERERE